MEINYTNERAVLLVISFMKEYGVKKVIASPGGTNVTFVASIQQDPYFEIISCVDERSAAYMACGLSAETGEAVALSCTGATASRNYTPALTEAYYRKLPILAITSTQPVSRIGHNIAQVVDRTSQFNDICNLSVQIPEIKDAEDEENISLLLNKAFLELNHRGGGPVHINLTTTYNTEYHTKELPKVRRIKRVCYSDPLPQIPGDRVAIFVGAHKKWTNREVELVDEFCKLYNGVVLCDQTSNFFGKYKILAPLVATQEHYNPNCKRVNLLIDIGDVSGAYYSVIPQNVWRVNPDGELRQRFSPLTAVFEMREQDFFSSYIKLAKNIGVESVIAVHEDETLEEQELDSIETECEFEQIEDDYSDEFVNTSLLNEWKYEDAKIRAKIPDIPFSHVWVAAQLSKRLPVGSVLHLGILNALRSWNYFNIDNSITGYSNTGGFGIDGNLSTVIGASMANKDKLYFLDLGDLSFFYDMNSIGNRHVGKNLRILLINNGRGAEFRQSWQPAYQFGDATDKFIAAAGHYGNKSIDLVRHFAKDLGYIYYSASNKEEFASVIEDFSNPMINESIILEVFTEHENESAAIDIMRNLEKSTFSTSKAFAKRIIGQNNISKIKSFINK